MIKGFASKFAPIAALALGMALSACSYNIEWGEVEGVPLAELDTSGPAPTEIELAGPDRLIISEGEDLSITVEGDTEASEALRFDRDGERLTIARDMKIFDGSGAAIIRVTMPPAETLGIAGSGTIEAATIASKATLQIAGSGDITVEAVEAESLSVEIAGSGDVRASGTAAKLSVEIAGAGNVRLGALVADDVTVEIAGSGDVELASNGTVKADIAGSGDVRVTGTATCSLSSAGSGSLTCREEKAAAEPGEAEVAAEE